MLMNYSAIFSVIFLFGQIKGSGGNIVLEKFVVVTELYCIRRKKEAECQFYVELDMPDLGYKRPFYNDLWDEKPFSFISEEPRIRIQIKLLKIFLKSGGQFSASESYWTQLGVATGSLASISIRFHLISVDVRLIFHLVILYLISVFFSFI